ncbi:hypothetical protein DDI_2295 [Dickeya dianthicola RNS04.9]|nr:hypothetical protein DDI_2295 [Dickeya dianthicola RNS04.9]
MNGDDSATARPPPWRNRIQLGHGENKTHRRFHQKVIRCTLHQKNHAARRHLPITILE